VDADGLSRQQLEELAGQGPVLLAGALGDLDTQRWCRELRRATGRMPVVCKQQAAGPADNVAWEAALDEFLDEEVPESRHGAPRYLFEEDLLLTAAAREAGLPDRVRPPERLLGRDWFGYFPEALRPSPCCLVGAGEGARSTLHRDPFEWTGTSLCVQGSKLWTFLPPGQGGVQAVDAALQAYRFPYEGFDLDGQSLAAGWQADWDLYAQRAAECRTAGALSCMSEGERLDALEGLAAELRRWWAEPSEVPAPGLQPLPSVRARLPEDVVPTCVLQREGDLLLIPAHWWHQTYAPEPSLAVSGQYMNEANAETVMRHVSEWCGSAMPPAEELHRLPPGRRVLQVLQAALLSQEARADSEGQDDGLGEGEEGELHFSIDDGEEGLFFPLDDLE